MVKANVEQALSRFITDCQFEDISPEAVLTVKNIVLSALGTAIAGAHLSGIKPLVDEVKGWGGQEEAAIFIHGGRVPAHNAAFVNSVMARALDFDDAFTPGPHFGAAAVPAAIAAAELRGGCSGKEFLTALALGIEVSARLNLNEEQYNGFDPTGVCSVFAASAAAGRLLGLTPGKMLHNLALAFNRCSGSFQSHISGSLAVRLNQGFVAQNGILSARLARIGMTGPEDFLSGIYGYFHLYGKDQDSSGAILDGLGKRFKMVDAVFKKYPSCGATQACTEAMLALIEKYNLVPEDVSSVEVSVTPYAYRLVGKDFKIGDNPRVDAQFSIQYCVANALLRRSSRLEHFDDAAVKDPLVSDVIGKVRVSGDPALDAVGHTALRMTVITRDGRTCHQSVDTACGFPGRPLTREDHLERFRLCLEYARDYYPIENMKKIRSLIDIIENMQDVRLLLTWLKGR